MPNNPKPVILTQEGEQIFPLTDVSLVTGLADVATSGDYDDLLNKPTLATVATSGSYNDLTNKPTIPTVVSMAAADIATAVDTAWNAVMS